MSVVNPPQTPVFETTTEKTDALDWSTLPQQDCDLNYRPLMPRPQFVNGMTLAFVVVCTLIMLPIVYVVHRYAGIAYFSMSSFVVSAVVGATLGLGFHLLGAPLRWVLLGFTAPTFLWALLVSIPCCRSAEAAVLVLHAFAIPLALWFADAIATHALHWMSAHYQNGHATMLAWRADWELRFAAIPDRVPRRPDLSDSDKAVHRTVQEIRSSYRMGFLWLPMLTMISCVAALQLVTGSPRSTAGISVFVSLSIALAIAGAIRSRQFPGSLVRTWLFFTDWIWHGAHLRQPPWVFQSPGGNILQRQIAALVVLFAATMTLLPLSDYFRWLFFGEFNTEVLPEHLANDPNFFRVAVATFRGNFYPVFLTLLHYLLLLTSPAIFVFLVTYFVAGPVINAHHRALEAPHAYEHHHNWNRLDGYSERLRNSRNVMERNSLIVAQQLVNDFPVLVHLKLYFEHVLKLGATGIGKTVLGLMTDTIQLIRRNDGAVIVIDCKGDMALFNTAREEARAAGRKFKWFTTSLNKSTYIYNPFDEAMYQQLSLAQIVGLLMNALNLHHGADYGRAWFTIASRILMKRSFEETLPKSAPQRASRFSKHQKFPKIESFKDLNDVILFLAADGKEYQAAQHLAFLIESLAEFDQLNFSPKTHHDHAALNNAINMSQALEENEVIYFFLEGAIDSQSVSEIGRLAIYSMLNACMRHKERTGQKARAYLVVDEAQLIIAQNITHVLEMGRSSGLACILAHQTMSQLNPPGGADLRELVMGCTSVKQIFSARDPWLQKYVTDMSGKVIYANLSHPQHAPDIANGHVDLDHVIPDERGYQPVTVTTYLGNRLNTQDILNVNRDPNMCLLAIERAEGLSRWIGFAPAYVDWPMHELVYNDRADNIPWPEESPETITLHSPWPDPTAETLIPNQLPALTEPEFEKATAERLKKFKRDLDEE